MFSSGPNYTKLKTNLRLAQNRLKLIEKKKSELTQKARKEIAEYLVTGKIERARIRVEHIIREDYLVEAMEIVELYCDLLLARFGLVTQMKELDEGIAEAVSSVIWVCPRLQSDVTELKMISDIFIQKYGQQFAERTRTATGEHKVSENLMHKLQLQAPPKLLVEKYLIEIAKNYNIEYEPDPQVMRDENKEQDHFLVDLSDRNNLGGDEGIAPPQMGFIGYPSVPPLPSMPESPKSKPFNYPAPFSRGAGGYGGGAIDSGSTPPFSYNIPPNARQIPLDGGNENNDFNINTNFIKDETNIDSAATVDVSDEKFLNTNIPKPQPRLKLSSPENNGSLNASQKYPDIPNLPSVPSDFPDSNTKPGIDDDIDFDDLSRRFETLKNRK